MRRQLNYNQPQHLGWKITFTGPFPKSTAEHRTRRGSRAKTSSPASATCTCAVLANVVSLAAGCLFEAKPFWQGAEEEGERMKGRTNWPGGWLRPLWIRVQQISSAETVVRGSRGKKWVSPPLLSYFVPTSQNPADSPGPPRLFAMPRSITPNRERGREGWRGSAWRALAVSRRVTSLHFAWSPRHGSVIVTISVSLHRLQWKSVLGFFPAPISPETLCSDPAGCFLLSIVEMERKWSSRGCPSRKRRLHVF